MVSHLLEMESKEAGLVLCSHDQLLQSIVVASKVLMRRGFLATVLSCSSKIECRDAYPGLGESDKGCSPLVAPRDSLDE